MYIWRMQDEIRKEVNINMILIKWNCMSDWGVACDRIYTGDPGHKSNMIFETQAGYLILK
jgi:hypothetical protein